MRGTWLLLLLTLAACGGCASSEERTPSPSLADASPAAASATPVAAMASAVTPTASAVAAASPTPAPVDLAAEMQTHPPRERVLPAYQT